MTILVSRGTLGKFRMKANNYVAMKMSDLPRVDILVVLGHGRNPVKA